jgi:Domain of unknown function (DUF1906)
MSPFIVLDFAENYGSRAQNMVKLGVAGVMRYFNPLTNGRDSGKSLTAAEARQYAAAGILVGIVVEGYGMANGTGVDGPSGSRDAREVLAWLPTVGLPPNPNMCVYFAVDTDASAAQINSNEVAYFNAIQGIFGAQPAALRPQVGIYGSGWSCMSMVGTKRADHAWVAGSKGWAHYADYVTARGWTLLQTIWPNETWNGMNCDTNTVNGTLADAGLQLPFAPGTHPAVPVASTSVKMNVVPPFPVGGSGTPVVPVAKPKGFIATVLDSFRKV